MELTSVRLATWRDVPDLVDRCERAVANFEMARWLGEYDRASATEFLTRAVASPDMDVLMTDGGHLIATLYSLPFNKSVRIASEINFYAEDGAGADLLSAFEQWARDKGAVVCDIATMHGYRHEAIDRLYRRMGFSATEHHYIKRLQP